MENRRRHYRHSFTSTEPLLVTLTSPHVAEPIVGTMVNLSIGGMRVESRNLKSSANERWHAAFHLPPAPEPMKVQVERVYSQQDDAGGCGFRILLPMNLNVREEQERQIWKFLLEEQRGERRRQREEKRAG